MLAVPPGHRIHTVPHGEPGAGVLRAAVGFAHCPVTVHALVYRAVEAVLVPKLEIDAAVAAHGWGQQAAVETGGWCGGS